MRRRELLLLGGAMAVAPAVCAQEKATPMIGFLGVATAAVYAPWIAAFRRGLDETGYAEGKNVTIEYRWAENNGDRLPALAADLVARKVDVIMTTGGTNGILAAKGATATIPIVGITAFDNLVATGLVAALGLDGGLISGELSRETAEAVARAVRQETGASHALAVLIEVDDGPDRIDFGGSIHLAIANEKGAESRRSRIYGGRDWVRLGAVELGLDCLRRYLQGLPVTERTDFERV